MTYPSIKAGFVFVLMAIAISSAGAQNSEKCRGPIYSAKEVATPAKITTPADLNPIYKAFGRGVRARVTVDAVLCRSGQVTDIKVVQSSLPQINDFIKGAVTLVRFKPAEMNYHTVSQITQFEFSLNGGGPLLIEEIDVVGNRRLTAKQILSWIKSRPGDTYDHDQIQEDFKAVLATGFFDKMSTRVVTEDAPRGGVRVIFEVRELPVIGDVKFEGLEIDPAVVIQLLRSINFQKDAPLTPELGKAAIRRIKELLEARGQRYSAVELHIENATVQTSNVIFVISKR